MKNQRLAAVVVLLGLAGFATPAHLAAQAQQRALYVTALDKSGNPVPELQPSDVIVKEDDTTREILRIAPASEPMQVAVMVDNSQAAERYIRDYREALPAFISALLGDEQVTSARRFSATTRAIRHASRRPPIECFTLPAAPCISWTA
jgi:hypothetical protein